MDRATLLGMTSGAAFMFSFGIVWLLIGLVRGRSSSRWLRLALLSAGITLGAAIATLSMRASRMPPSATSITTHRRAADRAMGRRFYIIFTAELAAIFVTVIVLRALHYPEYILPVIAVIVGVHFLPLAALFKSPVYYATGLLGCAIGVAGFFLADDRLRQRVVGLSFGALLWATATWITWTGLSVTPRV